MNSIYSLPKYHSWSKGNHMPDNHSRRQFFKDAAITGGAALAGTAGFLKVVSWADDPRKAPDQAVIAERENIKLSDAENDLRVKLFHSVNNNLPQESADLLKAMPDGPHAMEIAAYPFKKALDEGKTKVMEAFLDRYPKLANAAFKGYPSGTPLDFALSSERKNETIEALLAKGARFDRMLHPENYVSSSAYKSDLEFLQFLDSKGFKFPEMKGYNNVSMNSPMQDLIFGAKWEDTSKERLVDIAKFLQQKGYDPLEKYGVPLFGTNAIDYINDEYKNTKSYINEGGDPTKPFYGFLGTKESKLSAEESQANLVALTEYFKTLERQQPRPSGTRER